MMTLTEKILARAAGKAQVKAGDNVWVKADTLLAKPIRFEQLQKEIDRLLA